MKTANRLLAVLTLIGWVGFSCTHDPVRAELEGIFSGRTSLTPLQYAAGQERVRQRGKSALPALHQTMKDGESDAKVGFACDAIKALAREQKAADVSLLGDLEKAARRPDRASARSCLGAWAFTAVTTSHGSSLETLRRLLQNEKERDCGLREEAAEALGYAQDIAARHVFDRKLASPDTGCDKLIAVSGLKYARSDTALVVGGFMALITNRSVDFLAREQAAEALGSFGDPRVLPFLRQRLPLEPDTNTVAGLLRGLGRVGNAADIDLIRSIIGKDPYGPDGYITYCGKKAIKEIRGRTPAKKP